MSYKIPAGPLHNWVLTIFDYDQSKLTSFQPPNDKRSDYVGKQKSTSTHVFLPSKLGLEFGGTEQNDDIELVTEVGLS
jgi:hypothetical protein